MHRSSIGARSASGAVQLHNFLPRDATHSVYRLSVRDVEVCFSHSLEYFDNNFPRLNSLRLVLTLTPTKANMGDLVQREHPKFRVE